VESTPKVPNIQIVVPARVITIVQMLPWNVFLVEAAARLDSVIIVLLVVRVGAAHLLTQSADLTEVAMMVLAHAVFVLVP